MRHSFLTLLCACIIALPSFAGASTLVGYLDTFSPSGVVTGWTLDTASTSVAVTVQFVIGYRFNRGFVIGTTIANTPRPDVNKTMGYRGNHGFVWQMPAQYVYSGTTIYARAISPSGKGVLYLNGSPLTMGKRPSGTGSISGLFKGAPIVIKTSNSYAGAMNSLAWEGTQFINGSSVGYLLQSDVQFDGYIACFNPTEAGSENDQDTSTSIVQKFSAIGNVLHTRNLMAFWMFPGDVGDCPTPDHPSVNKTFLSPYSLEKTVTIGAFDVPNVIEDDVIFHVPIAHQSATFEALTGYMPKNFSSFYTFDPRSQQLTALSHTDGEQSLPVIFANASSTRAMGVYSPGLPQPAYQKIGYGRFDYTSWRFPGPEATVKWNCVYRSTSAIAIGDYPYTCFMVIGSLADVESGMTALYQHFNATGTVATTTAVSVPAGNLSSNYAVSR